METMIMSRFLHIVGTRPNFIKAWPVIVELNKLGYTNEVLNTGGLRNDKEFVNHKILDCMGDLYLSGYKIIGKVICSQGGHKLTNQLLRKVFKNKENFSILEIQEKNIPHAFVNKGHLRSIA